MRSQLESDRLDRKVDEFEAAHPNVDLTAIYENDKTEAARKALHKKAYASYKAFHFLKHGVKRGKELSLTDADDLSTAKKRLRDNDPYNFPQLDSTVRSVLSSEIDLPQLNDAGDRIGTPGRRVNGYTEAEFVEAYFGKDMARRLKVESLAEDPLYVEQKSYKEKFPLNSFLKMPSVIEQEAKLEKLKLENDPEKYPAFLPKDDSVADWLRHRTTDDLLAMRREDEINSDQEIDNPGRKVPSYAKEFEKVLKDHHKFHEKKHYDDLKYIDSARLGKEIDDLQWKFETGKHKDNADWYDLLKDPAIRRDDVEKRFHQ